MAKAREEDRAAGANIPREVAERINNASISAIGRMLSVNDNYGSQVMREAVLEEMNGYRRFVLSVVEQVYDSNGGFART